MKLSKIQELLRLVADSGVSEVEIEEDDFKLTIRQNAPQVIMQPSYPQAPPAYGPPQYGPQYGGQPGGQYSGTPQGGQPQTQAQPSTTPQPTPDAAPPSSTSNASSDASSESSDDGPSENQFVVKAPIVGTFYRCPNPDADPFVEVGDSVSEGDVLCIIEAMKLMNEIEAETTGTIAEILIEDGEPIEYDQPLFIINEK